MSIVVANDSLVIFVMQGERIFDAMRNVDIFRSNMDFEFYPKSVIHWEHFTVKLQKRFQS